MTNLFIAVLVAEIVEDDVTLRASSAGVGAGAAAGAAADVVVAAAEGVDTSATVGPVAMAVLVVTIKDEEVEATT